MSNLKVPEKFQEQLKQLTRFAFVGIVTNFAGYLLYLLITRLGVAPKITMTILYAVGATMGYFSNRNFTFSDKGSLIGSGLRFLLAHLCGYCLNLFILIIFVDHFHYPDQWVQAIAILVVAGFLFIAFKFFVFTNLSSSKVD
jgi:putative flippase GtrA